MKPLRHWSWIMVLILSTIEMHYWHNAFALRTDLLLHSAQRILAGHADWRATQSRLLGPFILVKIFRNHLETFTFCFLTLANGLFYRVARPIWGQTIALGLLALSIALWVVLIYLVSFSFDLIEMSVLTLFWSAAVAPRADETRRWREVTWLFLIQLLNRESALFLSAYLILCGGARLVLDKPGMRRLA
jgi:hypothetical protein